MLSITTVRRSFVAQIHCTGKGIVWRTIAARIVIIDTREACAKRFFSCNDTTIFMITLHTKSGMCPDQHSISPAEHVPSTLPAFPLWLCQQNVGIKLPKSCRRRASVSGTHAGPVCPARRRAVVPAYILSGLVYAMYYGGSLLSAHPLGHDECTRYIQQCGGAQG